MAFTLNRRLSTLIDSNGQLNTGKIPNDYITSDHVADNSITTAMLHTGFTLPTSSLSSIDTDNVTEGSSNLYFTNARAQAVSINNVVEDTTPQLGGDLASNGNDILFADSDKAVFGASSDLQIYHDGSASYIDDAGTGNLRIRANGSLSIQKYTGETMGVFTADGSVLLAHDNSTKLETTATGIDVTGTITTDSLTSSGAIQGASFSDGTISGITFIDEDSFATNSATRVPTQQSIKTYVDAQVAGVVDSAPAALDTLNELAAALGDDANFSTTTSTALGNRLRVDTASQGLTGTQQANAITNLGITATKAELNYVDGVTSNIQTQLNGKQATGSYLTGNQTITLSGDASGSGTTSIAVTIANDSHNHTNFNVSGITDLNSISGANRTHFRPFVSNFQASNRSGSNYNGGFEVGTGAANYGAQLVFEANAAITQPKFRNKINGTWGSWQSIFADGYHPNADALTTARTISLTGAVTGSVSFNGSSDVSIATTATADPTLTLSGDASGSATFTNLGNATLSVTVADDSHNHIISNVDGLQTALDAALPKLGGSITPSGWTAPSSHAALNIGYNGSGQTRAIDIDGGWVANESKAITFTHGSSATNMVGQWDVQHNSPGSRMRWGKLYHSGDSSTYTMQLVSTSATAADLYVTGNIVATGNVTAYSSDERLKTNITPIENPIEKVKQLNGVEFDWKDNVEELGFTPRLKHETGVIAQNIQSVIPDATPNAPFNEEYLTVQHEKIIPVLIEAIKEQQKQIEELKNAIRN